MKKSIIAITGPSGAGKTTLGNKLETIEGIAIPRHCTTRNHRIDDRDNFYRYLSHEEYAELYYNNQFLISSGDGEIIKKEVGNFYGVLIKDCREKWKDNSQLILFVSYKDLKRIFELRELGYIIDMINLTYIDIENGVRKRLNSKGRVHTQSEVLKRIKCALEYEKQYGDIVKNNSKLIIYTDLLNEEQTYEKVCKELKLIK